MKLLVDTHVLLWILQDDPSLSPVARNAYGDPANMLYFSIASYWELCIKLSLGKLRLAAGWSSSIERELAGNEVQWLSIQPRHVEAVVDLPWLHRDPFDRLLVAQSLTEGLALISADAQIAQYDVEVI
ncbi:MAG: type II toxin-antitoxin system VapC family toxin, partial [Spirochaetaceae bacterium]|nr:type II toxin-antitoxin system VapC family toxin [Spirochaetaceae bacterium]